MPLKILIVDDHEAAREGLQQLLKNSPITVGDAVSCAAEAKQRLLTESFDAVVVDVRMDRTDGLSLLAELRDSFPDLPVVMLSAFDNPTYVGRAVALGASDYVLKSDDRSTIISAIKSAVDATSPVRGGLFYKVRACMHSGKLTDELAQQFPLTTREAQVLRHIGLGLSNKEIGRSLDISIETVKEHVQNILRKISASDRTEAAVRAVRMGFVE